MAFFSERRRLAHLAELERAGVQLWNGEVPAPLRVKIENAFAMADGDLGKRVFAPTGSEFPIYALAASLLSSDIGVQALTDYPRSPAHDFAQYVAECDDDAFPDVLEAFVAAMKQLAYGGANDLIASVERLINIHLESYRMNYTLEQGVVVPFESREMHMAVVVPTLTLLANPAWEAAEEPYRNALKDIADQKYARAVTAATTSLQEGLRIAGCTGGDLKTLMASARSTIFSGFDAKYIDGVGKLIEWASATRANRGDVHKTARAEAEDAWLAVHLVGALLLRLSRMS